VGSADQLNRSDALRFYWVMGAQFQAFPCKVFSICDGRSSDEIPHGECLQIGAEIGKAEKTLKGMELRTKAI